jgi:DNA-binding NarL/FixJ family response regulator
MPNKSGSNSQLAGSFALPNPNRNDPRRILLVEDHPIVRSGIGAVLQGETGLEVCGVADDRASALGKIEALAPDLVLLDISLKDSDGMDLLKEILALWPEQKVLMLSMQEETLYAPRALRLGARGYVLKAEAPERLVAAIRQVLAGETYLSNRMGQKLLHGRRRAEYLDPLQSLSPRELQVFRAIGEGKRTVDIATELGISVKTVETFREHIKEKLNLRNGAELAHHAMDLCRVGF